MKTYYVQNMEVRAMIETISGRYRAKREALDERQQQERAELAATKRNEDEYFYTHLRKLARYEAEIAAMHDAKINERNKQRNDALADTTDEHERATIEHAATADIIAMKLTKKNALADIDDERGEFRARLAATHEKYASKFFAMNRRHMAEQTEIKEAKKHAVCEFLEDYAHNNYADKATEIDGFEVIKVNEEGTR